MVEREREELVSSSWRFSMELLSHVHTLRVFLFHSSAQVKPDQDCVSLEATLMCAPPALSCSWKTAHQACSYALRLPLPLLLFDYSAPPRISPLPDCIQLSLPLLSLPDPFHLHAFSSLSLEQDGIHTLSPNAMHLHNSIDDLGVQHQAFCASHDNSSSNDGDKSHAPADTHPTGRATACTSTVRICSHHDDASDHNAGHVAASAASDIVGCQHRRAMSDADHDAIEVGENSHRVCLHAAHEHDDICIQDQCTHTYSVCSRVDKDGIRAHKDPPHFNGCSSSLDEDGPSEGPSMCLHGRNPVDLPDNGSSLLSRHHHSTVLDSSSHQGILCSYPVLIGVILWRIGLGHAVAPLVLKQRFSAQALKKALN